MTNTVLAQIPPLWSEWYDRSVNGAHAITMGDRGRLVIPVEVRERLGLDAGSPLVLIDTDDGLLVLTRQQAIDRMRADLAGLDLVGELIAERRAAAALEDLP